MVFFAYMFIYHTSNCLQCFDAVG